MALRNRKSFYPRKRPYPQPYAVPKPTPEFEIFSKAQAQDGFRRDLVFLQTSGSDDALYTMLLNAVNYIGSMSKITKSTTPCKITSDGRCVHLYSLSIDNEVIAEGKYTSEASAKASLAQIAVEELQKTCFTIIRKVHPRSSPQVNFPASSSAQTSETQPCVKTTSGENLQIPDSSLKGGIGEKMMKKMGWGGGGLGSQEQGCIDIVENFIQVDRQGLGSKNIVQEVTKILQKHVASNTINSIAFSTDFSKEERVVIHQIARKLNLKSRSYGKADDRALVIQSKMSLIDLVRSLLEVGGENEQYQLLLPKDFNSS